MRIIMREKYTGSTINHIGGRGFNKHQRAREQAPFAHAHFQNRIARLVKPCP